MLTSQNVSLTSSINMLTPQNVSLTSSINMLTPHNVSLTSSINLLTPHNVSLTSSIHLLTPHNVSLTSSINMLTPQNVYLTSSIHMLTPKNVYLTSSIVYTTRRLVAYENLHYDKFGLGDKPELRSWINVALVFLTLLPARLFVNVLLRHRKAINAWQKKVIKGKIQAKDGKIITLVNQKVKLDSQQAEKAKVGDDVVLSMMPNGDFVLDIEIVKSPE
jgi:hypothetical protein